MSPPVTRASSGLRRARAYLAERLPVIPTALLSAVYVGGGFAVVNGASGPDDRWRVVTCAIIVFGFFLALRLADEHKDFERDAITHPDRLVQRGVVTLSELARAEIAVWLIMTGLAASLGLMALLAWLLVASYGALMRVEFFADQALDNRPLTYALTHQPVMLVLTGFVHIAAGQSSAELLATPLVWHQALCLCAMFGYEVSRKLEDPADQHPDSQTYSAHHGPVVAGCLAAAFIAMAVVACAQLLGRPYLGALILAAGPLVYALHPTAGTGKLAEAAASLALLSLHGALMARLFL